MTENEQQNRRNKTLFVLMLASGKSVRHSARISGIPESTAYRWNRSPRLQKAVQEARAEMFARAAAVLTETALEASRGLQRLLRSDSESIQLGAIRVALDHAVKVREAAELERRLQQLEEKLQFEDTKLRLRAAYAEVEAETEEGNDGVA